MKTKTTLLSIAIIAILPFAAHAANISGAMYVEPQEADENHPAPEIANPDAGTPFGRINIDTTDQEHIATTAYVKGAYNSAIAAVNYVNDYKQDKFYNTDTEQVIDNVFGSSQINLMLHDAETGSLMQSGRNQLEGMLLSAMGVVDGIKSQRVKIYTTWNNDTDVATTLVPFVTAPQQ